ncbi:hypothetical protein [Streptomyces sp. MBT53]|uniref:hypothetical protein n=1 Tax=Streptomyces sp. MBT53 TaxID=1488384 RepID=UPI0019127DA2|nr:hypothetical protein [Streptomyces sp. MBT53]MBK6019448.1 hypothetical protein [Streptomyces sp. MBT53]
MSVVNEPATPEACAKDYASRSAASPSPTVRAEAQNPGRITGNNGVTPQTGGAATGR